MLKKDGIFIIIDGYMQKPLPQLTQDELLAKRLIEKGMTVNNFEEYSSLRRKLHDTKFEIVDEENVSQFILPTLQRFEKMATFYLSSPLLVKDVLYKVLDKDFTKNIISGYLMPYFIENEIAVYMITVARVLQ